MTKRRISTAKAPQAVGPYSQGIRAGAFLFVSGQVPLDPESGELIPGDIAQQTGRALENLKAVVEAAGATLDDVVKTTVYLRNMGDFSRVNEIYERFFEEPPPARAAIEVSNLPKGADIEIEGVAYLTT